MGFSEYDDNKLENVIYLGKANVKDGKYNSKFNLTIFVDFATSK